MSISLEKNNAWHPRRGPVVLVVMDGVGYGKYKEGDAVAAADMRHFRAMEASCPSARLEDVGCRAERPAGGYQVVDKQDPAALGDIGLVDLDLGGAVF